MYMHSRNIPMAEKRIVCFQSKQKTTRKYVGYFDFLQLLYIFEKIF